MVTIKINSNNNEEISMKDLEEACQAAAEALKAENSGEKETDCGCEEENECCNKATEDPYMEDNEEVIYMDKLAVNFLTMIYSDMSAIGIRDMYFAAKRFMYNKNRCLNGLALSKATALVMVELLDYTRDLIDMRKED